MWYIFKAKFTDPYEERYWHFILARSKEELDRYMNGLAENYDLREYEYGVGKRWKLSNKVAKKVMMNSKWHGIIIEIPWFLEDDRNG